VELLVVIGIIALLISILLPSLSKAREQGNRIKCASNLRQIAMGMIHYANDSKGKFPRTYHDPGNGGLSNNCKGGRGATPAANPFDLASPSTPVDTNNAGASAYLLLRGRYVTAGVFRCPSNSYSEPIDEGTIDKFSNFPTPMRNYNSYSYAANFPNKNANSANWKLDTSCKSDWPLAADINPGNGGDNMTNPLKQDVEDVAWNDAPREMAKGNSNNHKNVGQNVVYVDGHVSWWDTPFCGPETPGRIWRDNIYTNSNNVDATTGKGGHAHKQPASRFDVVLHPGDGAK